MNQPPSNDFGKILISIVIPTRNRAASLKACLETLAQQTLPAVDFEVIVVVDGSTDGTQELLARWESGFSLRTIYHEERGAARARNRGAESAAGRYLLFLDDDILPGPDLVEQHLSAQTASGGVAAVGKLELSLPGRRDWFLDHYQTSWDQHYARLEGDPGTISWLDCYAGNLSVPREIFQNLGGFNPDLPRSEDVELGLRLANHGLGLVYLPAAVGVHRLLKDASSLSKDSEQEGLAALALYACHPQALPNLARGFGRAGLRQVLLRRALLAVRMPPVLLLKAGRLVRNTPWIGELFRFIRSYCFWRGVRSGVPDRATWARLTDETCILMYHAFAGPGEPAGRFVVQESSFRRQLDWLKRWGYQVISLHQYIQARREYRLPPARSVVITLDDGYADAREIAFPLLHARSFPATVFLVGDRIGDQNRWDSEQPGSLYGRRLLSWEQVREMASSRIEFGAHTRSHAHLTRLDPDLAAREIAGDWLEQQLGLPVQAFAYPFGEYDEHLQKAIEQAGYLGACGVLSGGNETATPLFALKRLEVQGEDNLLQFAAMLCLGNDNLVRRRDRKSQQSPISRQGSWRAGQEPGAVPPAD